MVTTVYCHIYIFVILLIVANVIAVNTYLDINTKLLSDDNGFRDNTN